MSYGHYNNDQYNQGPATEGGYGFRYGEQPAPEQHEMSPYGGQQQGIQQDYSQGQDQQRQQQPQVAALSQQDFLAQVQFTRSEIRKLTGDVQSVATLHQRALQGDNNAQRNLDELVHQTSLRNTNIRTQIKTLKSDVEQTHDTAQHNMKKRQWTSLNDEFKSELQSYLAEEQRYQQSYREQISRQYRIANPDASEEEVRDASNRDWNDQGVFQQALSTNRFAQGQAALGAVRQRHDEMKKIEQQITELAALFQDLDTLVIQQEPIVTRAEEQTEIANRHLKEGNAEVQKSAVLARHRRKLKWWCVLVVVLILIAVGVGVGVGVYVTQRNTAPANNNGK